MTNHTFSLGSTFASTLAAIAGTILAVASAFFAYYTVRLAYINLAGRVGHRENGMFLGAVAFPVAALLFGWCSRWCFRKARVLAGRS
jgi:hypothetical protein